MKIITILVTYNATRWIDKCFGSLVNSTINTEIFVVDNNSSDDTVEMIKRKFPQVSILNKSENLGFGKANNVGLKIALDEGCDFVFLLNQDAWIEKDTIQKLVDKITQNAEYGVVAPLQMNGEGTLIDSLFQKFTIAENRALITDVFKGNGNQIHEIDFVNAACWLIPIQVIKKIGGFDPLFPHYGEDDDFLNRVKFHGFKVGLDISTKIFHDREHRTPKTDKKSVINESFTRELIDYKNPFISIKSKRQVAKSALKSFIKFFTSAFDMYYLYKIYAYFKIYKIHDSILAHRKQEVKPFHHYL